MKKYIKRFLVIAIALSVIAVTHISGNNRPDTDRAEIMQTTAKAEEVQYSRILSEDTTLYFDPELTDAVFNLPYSYFVKVISVTNNYAQVKYMDDEEPLPSIIGYIAIKDLNLCDEKPQNPYPNISLQMKHNEQLYKDTSLKNSEIIYKETTNKYYGDILINGEEFYYLHTKFNNGRVGYMRKKDFIETSIPDHPLPIKTETETQPALPDELPTDNQVNASSFSTLKLVAIIAAVIAIICIVYFLFRPKTTRLKTAVTDENDSSDF